MLWLCLHYAWVEPEQSPCHHLYFDFVFRVEFSPANDSWQVAEWKPRCLPGQMMEFHCPAWTQLIRTPTCDWHNGSAHDRVMFLLSKQQGFEPIFSLWWKIVRKTRVRFMFYMNNVGLLTGLREFNFYGLVLKQQWEISPPSVWETKQHQDISNLEDLF